MKICCIYTVTKENVQLPRINIVKNSSLLIDFDFNYENNGISVYLSDVLPYIREGIEHTSELIDNQLPVKLPSSRTWMNGSPTPTRPLGSWLRSKKLITSSIFPYANSSCCWVFIEQICTSIYSNRFGCPPSVRWN